MVIDSLRKQRPHYIAHVPFAFLFIGYLYTCIISFCTIDYHCSVTGHHGKNRAWIFPQCSPHSHQRSSILRSSLSLQIDRYICALVPRWKRRWSLQPPTTYTVTSSQRRFERGYWDTQYLSIYRGLVLFVPISLIFFFWFRGVTVFLVLRGHPLKIDHYQVN